jgi:intein/homing endonuclease
MITNPNYKPFKLSDSFINNYKRKRAPFGFNGLGELVYMRTYSRLKTDGKNEMWWETVQRVVEGTFNMQKRHIEAHSLGWNPWKAQHSAQEMYDRIFSMKFLPPGRGLWAMGTPLTEERGLFAALNNCAFVSTENIKEDLSKPFTFLMDASMLGVGVGFDTLGAGNMIIKGPNESRKTELCEIPDTRQGWVESLKLQLESHFLGTAPVEFDYSQIREEGVAIAGFGGVSSGPEPLKELHDKIDEILGKSAGEPISITVIVDIMNLIGKCVVSGNVRRSAEIVFGDATSQEYLDLKNYEVNPHRAEYGWTSNNSIFAELGMDYTDACERVKLNGEPGFAWLENMQNYSRMNNGPDHKDHRASGGNPCFTGDTKIAVADGRGSVSIKELAESGDDVAVYSMDKEGLIEIKMGRNPRLTRKDSELVEIKLEDGSKLRCTPDHKFILNTGEIVEAKDLKKGSSLPSFKKYAEKISQKNPNHYLRMYKNTRDSGKDTEFEHRMIAKYYYKENYDRMYDVAKSNGWLKGGLVVHHKDYNSQNNSPENLEWMTFKEHTAYHARHDRSGENNGMFSKTHSEETKTKIGDKSIERWATESFRKKQSAGITEVGREKMPKSSQETRRKELQKYYIEQDENTDLDTVWIDEKLHAVKPCIVCSKSLVLEWRSRHQVFCSISCSNSHTKGSRAEGLRNAFKDRQQKTLHNQIMMFKDLVQELGRQPWKKEWELKCKENDVACRLNKHSNNPFALSNFKDLVSRATTYNHRVSSVRHLDNKEDVYNLTVDDNHNVGIILEEVKNGGLKGIFALQCLEQTLESYELCCLVETFPTNHDSLDDYLKTLKYAYMYAKTVTLGKTHWPETNRVMLRNRRIGCSMSGIAQFISIHGLHELRTWMTDGYDIIQDLDTMYSDWLAVPKSIKTTSIKPSGTVSLLAGATPGMHYPESRYYIRRMRLSITSPLIPALQKAGYSLEPAFGSEASTLVVGIPVDVGEGIRTASELSLWEQLSLAAFIQKYWADNQVSCTVTFDPETEGDQIAPALDYFQYQLKGISFLPRLDYGAYPQMPYEAVDKETYEELLSKVNRLSFGRIKGDDVEAERFCDNDVCEI